MTPEMIRKSATPDKYTNSLRYISTPSSNARDTFLYAQEVGYLHSLKAHRSSRKGLDSYLFLYVWSGSGKVMTGDVVHNLKEGSCILIDCSQGYYHESNEYTPWELLWVHFNGKNAKSYFDAIVNSESQVLSPADSTRFRDVMLELIRLQDEKPPCYEAHTSLSLTTLLTYMLDEKIDVDLLETEDDGDVMSVKLRDIRTYLDEHYREQVSLDMLSKLYGVSKFYLCREFKDRYTYSILNYITTMRLNYAKELLRFTSHSIQEVASLCGVMDANYFNKVFKKTEGITPTDYRIEWFENNRSADLLRRSSVRK